LYLQFWEGVAQLNIFEDYAAALAQQRIVGSPSALNLLYLEDSKVATCKLLDSF
jgi:hypothetical protein